jgi:hypothetical protein
MRMDYQPDAIDFTVASLDEPERVPPFFHIWLESRLPWFDTSDELLRHGEARPEIRALASNTPVAIPKADESYFNNRRRHHPYSRRVRPPSR